MSMCQRREHFESQGHGKLQEELSLELASEPSIEKQRRGRKGKMDALWNFMYKNFS